MVVQLRDRSRCVGELRRRGRGGVGPADTRRARARTRTTAAAVDDRARATDVRRAAPSGRSLTGRRRAARPTASMLVERQPDVPASRSSGTAPRASTVDDGRSGAPARCRLTMQHRSVTVPSAGRRRSSRRRAAAPTPGPVPVRARAASTARRARRGTACEPHGVAVERRRGRRRAASSRRPARRGRPARRRRTGGVAPCSMRGEQRPQVVVVLAALHRQRRLARPAGARRRRQALGDVVGEAEAVEGRGRHDDGVVVGRLGEAGLHVAAEAHEAEVGPVAPQLDLAAERAGGHLGALGQVGERSTRPARRAGRPARARPRCTRPGHGDRRQVLGAVHGEVGAAVEDRGLHLLGEHALAAQLPDRHVEAAVALRVDDDQLDRDVGVDGARAARRRARPASGRAGSRASPPGACARG